MVAWVRQWLKTNTFPVVTFVALVLVFTAYGVSRVDTYLASGYDLGIFDQVVRRYAHFQAPMAPLKGDDYNIFADHFHPIIALWAPLYWVYDNIRVLIFGQAFVVALAVFPVWRFVRRKMSSRVCAGAGVVAMMLGWPVECLIDFDVHEVAFAIPLVAWVIDALDRHADRSLVAACLLLLLVREDMGAIVAVVGLLRVFRGGWDLPRKRDSLIGFSLIALGLGAFAVITSVVIPYFGRGHYSYWDYSFYQSGMSVGGLEGWIDVVLAACSGLFVPVVKTWTWVALLAPVAFLALASPYALVAFPIMAERMLSDRANLWTTEFHYNAPVWVIVCLAAMDALDRLPKSWLRWIRTRSGGKDGGDPSRPVLAGRNALACIVAATMSVGLVLGATHLVPAVSAVFPFARMVTGEAFTMDSEEQARADVIAWIPANTCVVADDRIAGQLTHTNRVTVPGVSRHRQDFYVLDLSEPSPATTPEQWTTTQTLSIAVAQGFHEVFRAGDIVVLQSETYTGPDPMNCGAFAN